MDRLTHLSEQIQRVLGDFYAPVTGLLKIMMILGVAFLAVRLGSGLIRKVFEKQKTLGRGVINERRMDTSCSLLLSIFRYGVYIMAGVTILGEVFNMKSVLAAAGVGGVALGLGAQSLIRDVISGFFIVMEDHFAVGDTVTLGDISGTVEGLELRVTRVRGFAGELITLPNGEIKRVINHSRGIRVVNADIPLSHDADIPGAWRIADRVVAQLNQELADQGVPLHEPLTVAGVQEFTRDAAVLRMTCKTDMGRHVDIERAVRKAMKEALDAAGIPMITRNRL